MIDARPKRKTFPLNALMEGKRALVVGGGRVGQRKVELLLDAGAVVDLVCPVCVAELEELARKGLIQHADRAFEVNDVAGCLLVFACTDNKVVNRRILEVAQAQKILCCCADGNWPDGDFVTPAIIRADEVLIAVSTSGKSCRQSRLIKDNLRKHLDSIKSSDLFVLGTSHEYLSAEARAAYHILASERAVFGEMVRQVWGVHEFFILNTCNRIEIVAAISKEASTSGILRRLLRFDQLAPECYYMKHGFEAFAHLCRVTAGMDSQMPGESHVVSQMKDAVDEALSHGWAGSIIRELCDAALHVSKDIRQEVEPLLDIAEIEDVALRYLEEMVPALAVRRVVVIGTGVVGQGLMAALARRGCVCTWVYYRKVPVVEAEFAERIEVVQIEALAQILPQAEVIISALDTKTPVLSWRVHRQLLHPQGVYMLDLGMPRNIDSAFDSCGEARIHVADLDTLKRWYRAANGMLDKVLETCDVILRGHRNMYERMRHSIQGVTMAPESQDE